MFPQSGADKFAAWFSLEPKKLCQIFMNSADRLNGKIPTNEAPYATKAGLFVDTRLLHMDSESVRFSLLALNTMVSERKDIQVLEDAKDFINPIFKAIAKAKISEISQENIPGIVKAVKDVQLPDDPFEAVSSPIIMF